MTADQIAFNLLRISKLAESLKDAGPELTAVREAAHVLVDELENALPQPPPSADELHVMAARVVDDIDVILERHRKNAQI